MAALALGLVGAGIGAMVGGTFMGMSMVRVGWTVGSTLGRMVSGGSSDGMHVTGPRLSDLRVQAATEGSAIPTLYGTSRMAGNIIWSTPINETKHTESSGGGKGGGGGGSTQTTYTYDATFAVAFCEGPIVGVRRIWADSVLIYDVSEDASADSVYASGSIKSGIHVVEGTETQQPSSIIEAVEGIGNTPAYRGICYIIFDDLQLEKYGNRIPNITAEVVQKAETTGLLQLAEVATLPIYLNEAPCLVSFDNGTVSFRTDPNDTRWQFYNESQLDRYSFDMRGVYLGVEDDPLPADLAYPGVYLGHIDEFLFKRNGPSVDDSLTYADIHTYSIYPGDGNALGVTIDPVNECFWLFRIAPGNAWYYEKYNKDAEMIQTGQVEQPSDYIGVYAIGHNGCDNGMFILDQTRSREAWYVDNYTNKVAKMYLNDSDDWVVVSPSLSFGVSNQLGGVADSGYLFLFYRWSMGVITDNSSFSPLSVPLNEIVEDLCDRVGINSADIDVSSLATIEVQGYVRTAAMPSRSAIEPLLQAYQLAAAESDDILKFFPLDGYSDQAITDDDLAAHSNNSVPDKVQLTRSMDTELPRRVEVTYSDQDGDYQIGNQLAQRILR